MDAFYASVATRDHPDLRDVPVLVAGGGRRGVVMSASYPARAYGVHSGQPLARARRLCPDVVVLPPEFALFEQVSAAILEQFLLLTPQVEMLSAEEAFLDVRAAGRRYGSPRRIAEEVRARMYDEQRITCSVGVAPAPAVAKIAGRLAKPDGLAVVPPDRVVPFLHPLDVGELWGVGESTRTTLHRLGLFTVGDVAHTPAEVLHQALGAAAGSQLHRLAWGNDQRVVTPRRGVGTPDRSMGSDMTFDHDTDDPAVVHRELLRLSGRVAGRLRAAGVAGRTVTLRLRFADFTTITRSRTRDEATDVTQEVYRTALAIHRALGLQRARIRLVGIRVEGLVPRGSVHRQLVLGERERGWDEADRAVDRAARRFGASAVGPASLLG